MRRLLSPTILATALLVVSGAPADDVVLKDGRVFRTVGPPALKGRVAILKTADGQLLSVPVDEIDQEKTAAARLAPISGPAPTPTPNRPLTPVEASRLRSGKKAAVVLTDDQVAGGLPSDDADKKDASAERVEVSNPIASKVKDGYAVSGTVVNTGKAEVAGVGVTIELIGEGNKTLVSGFGQVAKETLAPGERSAFRATISSEAEAVRFRYVPTWQARIAVRGAAGEPGSGAAPANPADRALQIVPTPTPGVIPSQVGEKAEKVPGEKAPSPTPLPRPDIAPRAPNAPVGAPDKPGGTFIPKPTGDQPKPPSGN
jgi:hypothetical protein